ncbi:hypothetical protein HK102_006480 [Quaeritorhiza haematococci]|nr:hypothetical protein HK102_006480 [Quaeritorhiza haematococci]
MAAAGGVATAAASAKPAAGAATGGGGVATPIKSALSPSTPRSKKKSVSFQIPISVALGNTGVGAGGGVSDQNVVVTPDSSPRKAYPNSPRYIDTDSTTSSHDSEITDSSHDATTSTSTATTTTTTSSSSAASTHTTSSSATTTSSTTTTEATTESEEEETDDATTEEEMHTEEEEEFGEDAAAEVVRASVDVGKMGEESEHTEEEEEDEEEDEQENEDEKDCDDDESGTPSLHSEDKAWAQRDSFFGSTHYSESKRASQTGVIAVSGNENRFQQYKQFHAVLNFHSHNSKSNDHRNRINCTWSSNRNKRKPKRGYNLKNPNNLNLISNRILKRKNRHISNCNNIHRNHSNYNRTRDRNSNKNRNNSPRNILANLPTISKRLLPRPRNQFPQNPIPLPLPSPAPSTTPVSQTPNPKAYHPSQVHVHDEECT